MLPGMKTYFVAAAWVIFAVAGWFIGEMPSEDAMRMIFEATGLSTLRAGVAGIKAAL